MATFKDANSRPWTIALDAPTIRAIRKECDGLDLAGIDGKAGELLATDPCLLVDVLWILCREAATKDGLTDDQFGRALVGDAIERATGAMLEAIADFFPSGQRKLVNALAAKNKEIRELGTQRALDKIDDPVLTERIISAMEDRMDEEITKTLTRLNSATNSPASAESIPVAIPLEN